jgi:DNA-binding transcriptional ArsR family regulator
MPYPSIMVIMSSGLDSLLKILKDETRRKIVLLLNEKGSMSYTDLMETLNIVSTGTLNYHLKVLGELLTKNDAGQYLLTDKGKLASRLLIEFPEPDNQLKTKKKWWRRFWIVSILLQSLGFAIFITLYFLKYVDLARLLVGLVGFASGIIFLYFFYRMIRPPDEKHASKNNFRTIKDVFVSGRAPQEVKEEIMRWIKEEGINIEVEREDFVRGCLGIPSGLGWTAPKYFEVSLKSNPNGVTVHTEGWISLYDVSERSFSKTALTTGGIPRKKGWEVIERLWNRLHLLGS